MISITDNDLSMIKKKIQYKYEMTHYRKLEEIKNKTHEWKILSKNEIIIDLYTIDEYISISEGFRKKSFKSKNDRY